MKRIFKLKGELALLAIISLVIAIIAGFFLKYCNIINDKSPEKKIQYVNGKYINYLKDELKKADLNDKKVYEIISAPYYSGFRFYVVNKYGDVLVSNDKEVKRIDAEEIKDGERKAYPYKRNAAISEVTGCDYLKDGYYLCFVFVGYTTAALGSETIPFIIFIILFPLLSLGRINYIITINNSIKAVTHGDLSRRVPLKYKNELRELAEDINYMTSKLEREDEKRKEFLTNISHDLRTPLTSILGYLNMINEKKYEDEKELQNYISKINNRSVFLKSMLDNLFQYSKLASADIGLQSEPIYLQELLRQLVEEEKLEFQNHSLKLSLCLQQEPLNIEGDGELLVRAIDNLLSNALKYSKADTVVNVALTKKQVDKEQYAVISVSNVPKEPISEEEVKSFFERLYKKDKSRNDQGSGLGLSIVKEIAKIHHGFAAGKLEDENILFEFFLKIH